MNKKYKIGVFGSAEGDIEKISEKAEKLGKELGKQNIILVTGASTGLPYLVAYTAHKKGTEIWGFSPATNSNEHEKQFPQCDSSIYSKLIYVPRDYEFANDPGVCKKYRNVTSTATCNAGIIISGRWGTVNEFTNLFDMGKIIGVLTQTGGIADELEVLIKKISKPSKAKVVFGNSATELIEKVMAELSLRA